MGVSRSVMEHYVDNPFAKIEELERRIDELERQVATGLFTGTSLTLPTPTEDLYIVDAGTTGATGHRWVELTVGSTTTYIQTSAAK